MPAPPTASVRGALPTDLPALTRIAEAALTWEPDAAALVDLLWPTTDAAAFAVLAEVDGMPVGFAFGSLGPVPVPVPVPVPAAATSGPVSAAQSPAAQSPAASAQAPAPVRRGHVNMLAVARQARRRGIGSALLAELERRLFAAGAGAVVIGGATPVFAWPGVDVRYTAAACLVQARGYEPAYPAMNMTVELETAEANGRLATDADEERLRAEGVTVRRLVEADREQIAPWLTAWGGTWCREVLSTLGGGADAGTYIAVLREGAEDAEYVGFASYGVNRSGWFGPMGTGGPLRKLGIGGVLLRRALADMRAAGHATAQICWVGPVAFYARTVDGYVERVFWLYRKERKSDG